MSAVVIIPTYNEGDNIEDLIKQILDAHTTIDILVVDDNSIDGTGQIVERIGREFTNVHIIKRHKKLGLASAYQDGFRWALDKNFDYIIQMDGDVSHSPAYIPEMLKEAESGADLVVGSRYSSEIRLKGWSMLRFSISRIGNFYAHCMLRLSIRDLTSGFKCFRADFLRKIDQVVIRSKGYVFQTEMNYWCVHKGGLVKEMPIVFSPRKKGKSKFSFQCIIEGFFVVLHLALQDIKIR